MKRLRLAVLISGRGSNLQALIDACKDSSYPAEIAVVISNTPDAGGLARAYDAGLPSMIVDHSYFRGENGKFDKTGFENTLAQVVDQHKADLVCLAGFMRILGPVFLKRFKDKVINIHPSLLPRHKGLDVHEAVLAAKDTVSGCSVHVVTAGMDEGPVIEQREVPVLATDTPETLAARVLEQEHALYPAVIRDIATGVVTIRKGRVAKKVQKQAQTPAAAIETQPVLGHHGQSTKESEKPSMSLPHSDASHSHAAHPAVADPEAVARSQNAWSAFTKATMLAGGVIAVILVLMAVFLV